MHAQANQTKAPRGTPLSVVSTADDMAAYDVIRMSMPKVALTLTTMAWPVSPKTVLDAIRANHLKEARVVDLLLAQDGRLTDVFRRDNKMPLATTRSHAVVANGNPVAKAKIERDRKRARARMRQFARGRR